MCKFYRYSTMKEVVYEISISPSPERVCKGDMESDIPLL